MNQSLRADENSNAQSPVSAEALLDETIAALTAADAERLEELLHRLETRRRDISLPETLTDAQHTAAKQRLLRQLLWETAGNLRLLRRILAMGEAATYAYGEPCGGHRLLPLTFDTPPGHADPSKELAWLR